MISSEDNLNDLICFLSPSVVCVWTWVFLIRLVSLLCGFEGGPICVGVFFLSCVLSSYLIEVSSR